MVSEGYYKTKREQGSLGATPAERNVVYYCHNAQIWAFRYQKKLRGKRGQQTCRVRCMECWQLMDDDNAAVKEHLVKSGHKDIVTRKAWGNKHTSAKARGV